MRHINFTIVVVVIMAAIGTSTAAVLYDASAGGTPDAQGWHFFTDPLSGALMTGTETGGVLTIDSTPDISESGGYFTDAVEIGYPMHPLLPPLDRTGDGFTLRMTVKIVSELHASIDRAGFSIMVLTSDNQGIELSFWPDTIFAQSDTLTHAEETSFATNTAMVVYDLAIKDNAYALFADDLLILTGPLRDYPVAVHPVYGKTDMIFFGDDTGSAQAQEEITFIEVLDEAIPEPATLSLLAFASLGIFARRRRQ